VPFLAEDWKSVWQGDATWHILDGEDPEVNIRFQKQILENPGEVHRKLRRVTI